MGCQVKTDNDADSSLDYVKNPIKSKRSSSIWLKTSSFATQTWRRTSYFFSQLTMDSTSYLRSANYIFSKLWELLLRQDKIFVSSTYTRLRQKLCAFSLLYFFFFVNLPSSTASILMLTFHTTLKKSLGRKLLWIVERGLHAPVLF